MTPRKSIPDAVKTAAVADYHQSGDTYAVVSARHGVSKKTLHGWVDTADPEQDLAYHGGWETIRGVKYPLFPERRGA
jgi:transposase-like protein